LSHLRPGNHGPLCLHNATVLTGYGRLPTSAVLLENGLVTEVFSQAKLAEKVLPPNTRLIDVRGATVAPGFLDSHIHGFKGHGTDQGTTAAVLQMSVDLVEYGVTSFCPTLAPQPEEKLLRAIEACTAAMGHETGARILGLHLEGPFLNPEKCGFQRPETLRAVDLNLMERLWQASGARVTNMTVAPELPGIRELALWCAPRGIVLQAGHTDATYEQMVEGFQVGILHSTHFYNAMSGLHHRNPGVVGAVLAFPEVGAEIIADGLHVHPELIHLLLRDKNPNKLVLITDALTPTEQALGPLFANGVEVVPRDGLLVRKTDGVIAGSSLTMIQGLKNLVEWGVRLEDAAKMASTNPAALLGFSRLGKLLPGWTADLVVFDRDFHVLLTVVAGEPKLNRL